MKPHGGECYSTLPYFSLAVNEKILDISKSQLVPTEWGCPDQKLIWVRGVRSNHRPVEYESTALPLSYLAQNKC